MIKIYNTLTMKKQGFKPLKNEVGIYTCGPTVYDFAHIGNLRTYIFEDILRRALKYNGYKVKQVMNITDVEDKIIKKAAVEQKDIYAITKLYTKIFFEDLKKLNIEKAEFYPRATAHIKEMINLITILIKKNAAYKGKDGSIYFKISNFKNYGKLSQLDKRNLKIGVRVSADEYNKKEARDFVLWKNREIDVKQNTKLREIKSYWQSPWGLGRPGWHIECSAMAMKYLGKTFDIHAGGVDLIFPHHENEIAQSEAATGEKFSNYWMHCEHLLVNNEKMSKSLGNIFTLKDLKNKNIDTLAFRYLVLTSHYRSKLNFTWDSLKAAENALNNLYEIFRNYKKNKSDKKNNKIYNNYKKQFLNFINDDLNTPQVVALLWQVIKNANLSDNDKKQLILEFDKVLGLGFENVKSLKIPLKIRQMAVEREKSRINKQFIHADALRKQIESLGYVIEDTDTGPKILRKS